MLPGLLPLWIMTLILSRRIKAPLQLSMMTCTLMRMCQEGSPWTWTTQTMWYVHAYCMASSTCITMACTWGMVLKLNY